MQFHVILDSVMVRLLLHVKLASANSVFDENFRIFNTRLHEKIGTNHIPFYYE